MTAIMNNIETKNMNEQKKRLLAVDAVRGIAVIGMYIQHFALNERNANIVSGNTMILFFLCSGISYSLMSQGVGNSEIEEKHFRAKVLARSVFIDLLGYLLLMLNGPFAVVLTAYAALFIIALLLKNRSDKVLLIVSVSSFILSPIIMIIGLSYFSGSAILADILGGPLSAVALLPIFTAGMLIGRKDLRNTKRMMAYVIAGISLVVIIKLLSAYVLPGLMESVVSLMEKHQNYAELNEYAPWPKNVYPVSWNMLCTAAPQTGSIFSLLLGMGASLIVLGVSCLLENKCPIILKPFTWVGKAALTLYALQIILGWLFSLSGTNYGYGNWFLGDILVAVLTVIAGFLLSRLRSAPVEKAMRQFEKLFC